MDDAFVSQLLDVLYRGVADQEELKRALEMLAHDLACRSATLIAFDAQEPATNLILTTGVFAQEDVQRRYADFATVDPAPGLFAGIAAGKATTTDRLMSAEFRGTDIFNNEFFLPLGLTETLGANLFFERSRTALLGLQRGDERSAFTEEEIARIERLSPHLRRILQLRRVFSRLEAKGRQSDAVLDRLPAGLMLLDGKGRALVVNAAMRAIAARGDGFALSASGFPAPANPDARRRLHRLIGEVMNGGAGGAVSVPEAGGGRPYAVLVARAPRTDVFEPFGREGQASAIVIVHDPAARSDAPADILSQVFGLTEGAARLVLALAAEDDLKSYAERNDITIHTARFHLRTALTRTGARTQSELMRMVVPLLRDFAPGQSGSR